MATAETVLTVCSDPRMDQKNKALESWMRSKDSCPVWGEGIGKVLPSDGRNSPVSYSTVELSLSTLAGQLGAVTETLKPLHALIEAHVLAAERLHGDVPVCRGEAPKIRHGGPGLRPSRPAGGDDTTVPLLARGGTKTARLWTYVRDDRPFAGHGPPAVVFYFSRDRGGEHPALHLKSWQGILQADAYAGYVAPKFMLRNRC